MTSEKLRIVLFDGSFKMTSFLRRLLEGLQKQHDVYVLGFNEDNPNPVRGVVYKSLGSNQNKFRLLKTSLYWALQTKSFSYLLKGNRKKIQQHNLRAVLKYIQPDIVHIQWPSLLPWMEEFLGKDKYRFVLSQRGFHSNVRPFVNKKNFNYLKKWYPKIHGFHSVSNAISNNGDKIYNFTHKIDEVVYTGFPIDEFPFSFKKERSGILKILCVGRPHWKKGYTYALYACKQLKEKGYSFQYTIIGASRNEELLFLINDLELQKEVILGDKLSQQGVYDKMNNSDLLLFPSIEEGLPNVVVEAMLLGLPVISTKCGGVEEAIIHNENGWVVPTYNINAIADEIENFIKRPISEINKITVAARKKVEQQHNEEQMVLGMENLYLKCVNTPFN